MLKERLGAIKTLMMKEQSGREKSIYKYRFMTVFLLAACILTYYYHAILETGIIFTHLFYIPIILASIWWGKKGIFVAIFLGVMILISHVIFLKGVPFADDIIRAVMFVVNRWSYRLANGRH